MVDWIRRPYTVRGKVHDGPDAPIVDIVWYLTDLSEIDGVSVINSREWDPQKWVDRPVGELPFPENKRRFNGRWEKPIGLTGLHLCHAEWFASGEPWPNDLPPNAYDADNIPECCGRLPIGGVTIAMRPAALVSVTETIVPGHTCDAAPTIAYGVNYMFVADGLDQHILLDDDLVDNHLTYSLSFPASDFFLRVWFTATMTCGMAFFQPLESSAGTHCITLGISDPGTHRYLTIPAGNSGLIVTLRRDLGPCP